MKDFDSTYLGNKTDWRKEMSFAYALTHGNLLPSDYRILLA